MIYFVLNKYSSVSTNMHFFEMLYFALIYMKLSNVSSLYK